jgi:hypothetical protein
MIHGRHHEPKPWQHPASPLIQTSPRSSTSDPTFQLPHFFRLDLPGHGVYLGIIIHEPYHIGLVHHLICRLATVPFRNVNLEDPRQKWYRKVKL